MSGATERRRLVIEADGGSRGNPGVAGYGALVRDPLSGQILIELAEPLGQVSNNVAEYTGLIAGLRAVIEIERGAQVQARMDSKLVVEQMSGRWKIKHPDMQELALEARDLCAEIRSAGGSVDFEWIPREENQDADALSNSAMDGHSVRRVPGTQPDLLQAGGGEAKDLRVLLVQVPSDASFVDRVVVAAARLAGEGARVVTGPDSLAKQVGSGIASATGVAPEASASWSAKPGRAGSAGADKASSAAYNSLRETGGTVVVVTTRRGVVTVLAEVLALPGDRFWSLATAPGSLSAVEVWGDGTASVAFTNRTDHLA